MEHVDSFKDLVVYRKTRVVTKRIFELSKTFPKEEMYSLIDQVRRSSRSIGGQIAEAWAKRRYERHFVSKLSDADGEQLETQHWLSTAGDCGYLSATEIQETTAQLEEIGRMLNGMIHKAHLFCGEPANCVREQSPEYFVNSPDN